MEMTAGPVSYTHLDVYKRQVGTFAYWYITMGDLAFALERMVTVMVTACPHALGVAIPLVVAISTTLSATNGLLIRNRTAFETTRKLSTIIFDKTGTLTKGSHTVQKIIPLTEHYSENDLLQYCLLYTSRCV